MDIVEQMDKKIPKLKLIGMIGTLFFLVVLVLGFTYAVFSFSQAGKVENKITTGTLLMTVTDSKDLALTNASPMSDSAAMATAAYTFTVKNTGTLPAKYRLRFVKDEADYPNGSSASSKSNYIKYGVKIGSATATATVRHIDDNSGIIVTDRTLAAGASESYSIWLWIDNTTNIATENFDTTTIQYHGHVQLDAIQSDHSNYETGE